MEHSDFPQILCAIHPSDRPELTNTPFIPAWMCYQAATDGRLYRTHAPTAIHGGILMLSDSNLSQIPSIDLFCRQAVQECTARRAFGVCANWSKPPSDAQRQFTTALGNRLHQKGLSFWVTEPYADCCSTAHILISSALSGGCLRQRLSDAITLYGVQRVTLAVEWMCERFILPCPTGQGVPLTSAELQQLQDTHHPTIHYAEEFCTRYFTLCDGTQTQLILFDTPETLQQKLSLARSLGLCYVMTAWTEISACASSLFSSESSP